METVVVDVVVVDTVRILKGRAVVVVVVVILVVV